LILATITTSLIQYAMPPLVGLIIGWFTNYLAVKLLFRPKKPIDFKIFTLQGIFPKNKLKLANNLGNVVQRDLISFDDIKKRLSDPAAVSQMAEQISIHVENMIRDRLHKTKFQQTVVPEGLIKTIHQIVTNDIESSLPKLIEQYIDQLEEKIDIYAMVQQKVANFSDEKLENLILSITQKEFKFIELIGAVLGFLIGCIQVGLSFFLM
jgi:uncharacterized membrane protein YheB (UPF0754 family)